MKTALITGSTRGIGRVIGIDLLSKGHRVYFNYAIDDNSADWLDKYLKSYKYVKYEIIKANLSTLKGIDKLSKKIFELDYLILNAGITDRTPFSKVEIKNWQRVFDTNITIPFFLIQKLRNKIKTNGKIIFIGSVLGKDPDSTSISYGVSKGALSILCQYLAKEFASKKITVNVVAPGFIESEWHKDKPKNQIERIKNKTLLKRFGYPKEISDICQALINNDYITGQTIYVDGGYKL